MNQVLQYLDGEAVAVGDRAARLQRAAVEQHS
jgi:hypothetical protein